jgi:Transposase
VAYRKGQRDLLVVVDHDSGRIIWCAPGKTTADLHAFFDALGEQRAGLIEAVSCHMSGGLPRRSIILRRRAEGLSAEQRGLIEQLAGDNRAVYEGWLLVDQLRGVDRAADPAQAANPAGAQDRRRGHLWAPALRARGPHALTSLAQHLNAIALGITNARLEGDELHRA